MTSIVKTDAKNEDFITLVAALDADLSKRDGTEHSFYHQFNSIDHLKHVVVLYANDKPLGCGAIKTMDAKTAEVKRMYVVPHARGKGIATKILQALELWAATLGFKSCILETGKRQPEAIALYKKNGYVKIPNYGQYQGIKNSICFQKNVSS